ncbi:hypothetical protein HCN51_01055 [Nonomuraea sp. FMUSA5-5]|uniref:DUF5666 domain-containing protein n=1 Tax=Nonomuraea composti TaxID=2720023 RepID=A0ABX1AV58_9ACTN|nr:hypothetical protein [Nonomuraea sp. FMUSA5-5]NJP88057.1 hypothetical protein [Nonomuraea sp. FMUSA5-5]
MDKLDSSPFRDDLREELAVQPAKGTSKVTLALAAGVVLVAGILIGIQAESWFGAADAPPQAAGAAQQRGTGAMGGYGQRGQFPGGAQQPGGQQQPGGGGGQRMGGGTVGTVEKIEDGKVYVRTMDGATVTVTTTDRTTVQISKPGKVSDLETGTTIVVRGQQGADGAVTATSISQGSQGFQGGGPR